MPIGICLLGIVDIGHFAELLANRFESIFNRWCKLRWLVVGLHFDVTKTDDKIIDEVALKSYRSDNHLSTNDV